MQGTSIVLKPVYVCDQVHVHVCMCDYFTSGHDRLANACVCVQALQTAGLATWASLCLMHPQN